MKKSPVRFSVPGLLLFAMVLSPLILPAAVRAGAQITPPETFFGFRLGSDRKMASWENIVAYYRLLERESGKVKVVDCGPATMGNPFLLVIISSPENLGRLEELRRINLEISDPRGRDEAEIKTLVASGKAVICQSMSLHATEIGGAQMAPELAYDLASRTDEETGRILDNVVFLLVPSLNPDGAVMVHDWYQKTLGTEFEGSGLPWLYHKYAGHDNNRDGFQTNLVESRYMAKIMFRDWIPQAYVDHHQMGSYGARIYVPPYAEPVRPLADPLIWREHSWYGGHIAYKEEEAGYSGVLNAAQYSGWGHFGFHWITPFHNIAGMLTESASTRLASPLFIHPHQLRGGARQFPVYEAQTTFPNPWPGGWWRLRDIVDRKKVAAWAVLDLAARNKDTVLWNAYLKGKRQTERGEAGKPAAYVIPASQHDTLTAVKLVNKLLDQGIEIKKAVREFSSDGRTYTAGSFLVSLAQPKMGLIRYLLGRTFYPDNSYTRSADGDPIHPYDLATDTMAEFMGVRVDPQDGAVNGDFEILTGYVPAEGRVETGAHGFVLDGRLNDAFRAAGLLLDKGVALRRLDRAAGGFRPGDFIVPPGTPLSLAAEIAKKTGVDFQALEADVQTSGRAVKRMRTGMYQRYWGGNMDEGWTRLLLEQFEFPYTTLRDTDIKKGNLNASYDVIVLPDDPPALITGEDMEDSGGWFNPAGTPPEYRSGIGKEGVEALKAFVEKGGTLVSLGEACAMAVEEFALPVRDVTAGVDPKEFWCPGSTLRATFDPTHPLAYGMPEESLVLYQMGNPAFAIRPTDRNERTEMPAEFASRDLLQSGWLIGESILAGKAAVVSVQSGKGRVVLLGTRPQHRAQTHGTFKLLFNTLIK
ncbi:MAG: peptidase M14 family protein [Candidatus Aminicenantes bacterium]|nr:peptidase M14 family protein [Candidatus Aminicenantes bacterium]